MITCSNHLASIYFYKGGNMGPYERPSKSQGRGYPWVKTQASKIIVNVLCKPIIKLFYLMAKEGFLASWTINIVHMIFKSGERHSPGN